MLIFPAFLAIVSLIPLTVKAGSNDVCEDALKRSTNLCQRWKNNGLCGETNVRSFCPQSCNLCQDEGNPAGENDDATQNKYLGCFKDGVKSEFKLMSLRFPITVRSCVGACRLNNFKYAGLRNGKYCMCGNDYGSYGEVLKRDGCSMTCGSREPCGGSMENALYKADIEKMDHRHHLEKIEEVVLGKQKKSLLSKRRSHHKPHVKLVIPKTRSWDFESWIRRYEQQKEQDQQGSF